MPSAAARRVRPRTARPFALRSERCRGCPSVRPGGNRGGGGRAVGRHHLRRGATGPSTRRRRLQVGLDDLAPGPGTGVAEHDGHGQVAVRRRQARPPPPTRTPKFLHCYMNVTRAGSPWRLGLPPPRHRPPVGRTASTRPSRRSATTSPGNLARTRYRPRNNREIPLKLAHGTHALQVYGAAGVEPAQKLDPRRPYCPMEA